MGGFLIWERVNSTPYLEYSSITAPGALIFPKISHAGFLITRCVIINRRPIQLYARYSGVPGIP